MIQSAIMMNSKGLHARTSAMLASYVYKLGKKLDFTMHVIAESGERIPITHAVQITALSIRKGENINLEATGSNAEEALEKVCAFIGTEIDSRAFTMEEIDQVLDDNIMRINSEMNSLKEIQNQLSSILDNISDGICLMDRYGKIVYLNNAYGDIFKVDQSTLIRKDARVMFPDRPSVKALERKTPGIKQIFEVDGMKLISNAVPIMTEQGFQGIITSYSCVEDFKEVLAQLHIAEEKVSYYENELAKKSNIHEAFKIIVGESSTLKEALAMSSKAAKTSATVVVRGESGTGKELVANSIHLASKRSNGPLIKINCAAFPENLIESELFGYEKGAFTGAIDRKIGKFELADGGTLFLDEIGELSPNVQVKLLRFLQEKEFRRIGGRDVITVNVRIIAATNRNLEEMMKRGEFREDLYYRLSVIQVYLPPLRDRISDIPLLADYFIDTMSERESIDPKIISKEVLNVFHSYNWPGNIRELENVIMRGMTMSEDIYIGMETLPRHMRSIEKSINQSLINIYGGEFEKMEAYDREIIRLALKRYGSFNKTAKALGLTHRTVSLKAKKYGLI